MCNKCVIMNNNFISIYVHCTKLLTYSDIDECTLNIDDCDQLCVNDNGSYHCECYDGYFRDNNSASCVGKCIAKYVAK